ncbi:MAG TPA: molybdenum cofactor guanylyltransferase [Vicinamibacterales bacterium]|nr:molybdenum cofactor guanylyltransferase [Vicinamibacterales bacterium]
MDAAILAGGQARRLAGRDKSALLVGGLTILQRQLSVLHGVAERVVLIGGRAPRDPAPGLAIEAVPDLVAGGGALGGLHTALSAARSPHVLVLACDLPFVSRAFLRYLAALTGPAYDAIVPRAPDGWQPLCAIYRRDLAAAFGERVASGRLKVVDALAELRVREVGPAEIASVEPDERLFLNVNTPEDLARAIELLHKKSR